MNKALAYIAGFVCLGLAAGPAQRPSALAWVETPRYDAAAWLSGGERFPAGAGIRISDVSGTRALAPAFQASADPAVSFDGKRLLFSARQTAAHGWQVFEANLDGTGARQITAGEGDCVRPLYLPEDKIVYTRIVRPSSWIEVLPLAGGTPERLTFSGAAVLTDDVLRDGRVLFETEFHLRAALVREVMTVYTDGVGVEAVRCDHGADRHSARQTRSGDVVFIQGERLAKFTVALAREAAVVQPPGEFAGPVVEPCDGEFVAAVRRDANSFYRLMRWHAGARTGRMVIAPAGANAVEPVLIAPHAVPTRFPSALAASRTAVNLLCLNVHTSRETMPPGTVVSVRVFTQGTNGGEQLLGQTRVEKDGSFFVQTPADRPLRMELVDSAGTVVRAEKNWWWGRPAEQRICVGCHAGPERAPENAVPAVLLRKDVPVSMLAAADGGR